MTDPPRPSDEAVVGTVEVGTVEVDPRVTFAAERTVLAWIRTGLALMGFGFLVSRFGLMMAELAPVRGAAAPTDTTTSATTTGLCLVAVGMALNVWASARHVLVMRRLARGETIYPRARAAVVFGAATALAGAALLALLARSLP